MDILGRGRVLGVKFRAIASIGNCADVGPNEFLDYMLADPETKVIGFYLEKLRDGRMFFEALRGKSKKHKNWLCYLGTQAYPTWRQDLNY